MLTSFKFTFVPGAERIPENWYKRGAVYGNEGREFLLFER